MVDITQISSRLPSVIQPEFRLNFRQKLKWTAIILILYFVLGSITVFGVNPDAVVQFEFLEIVFGSEFGSLITLGIGPIVTASIILQLLVGSKILDWDTKTPEGRAKFTGTQKLLAILFCFFEAAAYVFAGAVPAATESLIPLVILQLAFGGILIILMDEVCSKWGFGSGVSLFIAAGVSKTIFVRIFSPPMKEASGGVLAAFISNLSVGQPTNAIISLLPLFSLIVVFIIVVFAQAMKIEIPMAFSMPFGKFAARRWPLRFIYTSNIPVILTAAVLANIHVIGNILYQKGFGIFGEYSDGQPVSGLAYFLTRPDSLSLSIVVMVGGIMALIFAVLASRIFKKYILRISLLGGIIGILIGFIIVKVTGNIPMFSTLDVIRALTYTLAMIVGATIFSIFWVNTAGMDARSVAEQFKSSYLMIPGFRRDPRIIERILNRYIPPLAVLGGAFVGFLAAFADLTGAIGTGTGILLTVMIIYQFYEQIAQQHLEDMHPALRKFMSS